MTFLSIFNFKDWLLDSGALWQESNSKIENYGCLADVTLFEKVFQPFFGMSTQLVTVQTMV